MNLKKKLEKLLINMQSNMTRAQIAAEYLKAKLPPDNMENLGMHESYRAALEDMVEYMHLPGDDVIQFTGIGRTPDEKEN